MREAVDVMRAAFIDLGQRKSQIQDRVRVHADGASLSMMGGIYGAQQVMGAKVYPTVDGQFDFVIPLFSAVSGKLLRIVQGNHLTRLRTAAVTRVVAERLANPGTRRLALFGSGVQASAHAEAFCADGFVSEVLVCAISGAQAFAADIRQRYGISALAVDAAHAVEHADIVVTATRSPTPLFDGALLRPGALVAAIGSSKPTSREVDDVTLARASMVVVESAGQALLEAGDLVMASDRTGLLSKLVELGSLMAGAQISTAGSGDIVFYKSVGVGLEDVALAHHVHKTIRQDG